LALPELKNACPLMLGILREQPDESTGSAGLADARSPTSQQTTAPAASFSQPLASNAARATTTGIVLLGIVHAVPALLCDLANAFFASLDDPHDLFPATLVNG